jgi:amino acid transporter
MADTLQKSLGVYRGTALMLNIVIGAGLLTLPGLAVKVAGGNALWAWGLCALAALPLLAVFIATRMLAASHLMPTAPSARSARRRRRSCSSEPSSSVCHPSP